MSKETNIRVICRFRPINALEKSVGGENCIKISDKSVHIAVLEGSN
jgi:hypothetical protein